MSPLERFKQQHGIKMMGLGPVGYSARERKWYGWSHRAIYGFGLGVRLKKGDAVVGTHGFKAGDVARTMEDAKQMAIAFAESVS